MSLPPLIARRVCGGTLRANLGPAGSFWLLPPHITATGVISLSALFDRLHVRRPFQRGNFLFQFLKAR